MRMQYLPAQIISKYKIISSGKKPGEIFLFSNEPFVLLVRISSEKQKRRENNEPVGSYGNYQMDLAADRSAGRVANILYHQGGKAGRGKLMALGLDTHHTIF